MKKVLFLPIVSCLSLSVFANEESIKKVKGKISLSVIFSVDDFKKASCVLKETETLCRACCTINATNSSGTQTITQTACVRNSDCTSAAVSACDVARLAALVTAMQKAYLFFTVKFILTS